MLPRGRAQPLQNRGKTRMFAGMLRLWTKQKTGLTPILKQCRLNKN
jgi:hypothetical protein